MPDIGPREALGVRTILAVVALGICVSLPALRVELLNDDLVHRLQLEGKLEGYEDMAWRLYEFTPPSLPHEKLRGLGYMPWFSHDSLSLRFLRPLSSGGLALDHLLFGRAPLMAHLHSLAWFALLTGFATAFYGRWFQRRTALLSGAVFALAGLHAMPTAWLSARHTLVAAAFAAMALWARTRAEQDGWRAGYVLAAMGALGSLTSSESGLGTLAFLLLFEATRGVSLRQRLLKAAPFLTLGAVYVFVYVLGGYGARGSEMYVSPIDAPGEFLVAAAVRVPALAGELFGAVPALLALDEPAEVVLGLVGCLVVIAMLGLLLRARSRLSPGEQETLRWLVPATILAVVPAASTIPSGRALPLAMIGGAAVVGNAMALLWTVRGTGGRRVRASATAGLALLGLLHFGLSPLVRVVLPGVFATLATTQRELATRAELGNCAAGGHLYLLTGSDPTLSLYAAAALLYHAPERAFAERFRVLSMAPHPQRLRRTGERAFELEVEGGPRRSNAFERLYRPGDAPLEPGRTRVVGELVTRVLESEDGLFRRVAFEFNGSPESTCLLLLREGRLRTLPWPAVGESVVVPHEPGPMNL